MDRSQFKSIFLQETYDRLASIEKRLTTLETGKGDLNTVDALFRSYHSIKGMCASMGYESLKDFSHLQEDLLEKIRNNKKGLTSDVFSSLFEALDTMKGMVQMVEDDIDLEDLDISEIRDKINHLIKLQDKPEGLSWFGQENETMPAPLQTTSEPSASEPGAALPQSQSETPQSPPSPTKQPTIRLSPIMKVERRVFDELLKLNGDLVTVFSGIKMLAMRSKSVDLSERAHKLERIIEQLNSNLLSTRMLQFYNLTQNLPSVVRDITRQSNKDVELKIEGGEVSLDMSVLEGVASPLIHIIRNALDHGIESPQERENIGKPVKGTITVQAFDKRDNISIVVSDDGRGIDIHRLKERARLAGMPGEQLAAMSEKEAVRLICVPGISLSDTVTDVSGRGVGMDVVKSSVEGVGGTLEIKSNLGKGTTIIMTLPRMASIIKILLLKLSDELIAIPITRIERIIEYTTAMVTEGKYKYNGKKIPVNDLSMLLDINTGSVNGSGKLIVLESGEDEGEFYGVLVQDAGTEIDAYIRPLSNLFKHLKGIIGYTVTDDKRPVFVLDTSQLESISFGTGDA